MLWPLFDQDCMLLVDLRHLLRRLLHGLQGLLLVLVWLLISFDWLDLASLAIELVIALVNLILTHGFFLLVALMGRARDGPASCICAKSAA